MNCLNLPVIPSNNQQLSNEILSSISTASCTFISCKNAHNILTFHSPSSLVDVLMSTCIWFWFLLMPSFLICYPNLNSSLPRKYRPIPVDDGTVWWSCRIILSLKDHLWRSSTTTSFKIIDCTYFVFIPADVHFYGIITLQTWTLKTQMLQMLLHLAFPQAPAHLYPVKMLKTYLPSIHLLHWSTYCWALVSAISRFGLEC